MTPAFRARASSAAITGAMCVLAYRGSASQMGSTTSKTSNAVVAGSSTTGTGSGEGGAWSVSGGLFMGTVRLRQSRTTSTFPPKAAEEGTCWHVC